MSEVAIRRALEVALNGMTPAILTAYENTPFNPPAPNLPYQAPILLPAGPDNPSFGRGFYRALGIFQVTLYYPLNAGSQAVMERAGAIRERFSRGNSWFNAGLRVLVDSTPTISSVLVQADRATVVVSIPYQADIFTP